MATLEDAAACAGILNDWIEETPWMPRVHPADDVLRHYREWVLVKRTVYTIGEPPMAYIALDDDEDFVTSLYARERGKGLGKALLDHAKLTRNELKLWTFQENLRARDFYEREDFSEIKRSDGDNEEKLPDILYRWSAQ